MTIRITRTLQTEEATAEFGAALGRVLRGGDVLGIDGPLGAGKTTLTRAIAEGLGLGAQRVSSPTFVIVNEYRRELGGAGAAGVAGGVGGSASAARPDLVHIDAYRLSGSSNDELDTLGWDRLIAAPAAAIVIEWAERIGPALRLIDRTRVARLALTPVSVEARLAELVLPDSWLARAGLERLAGPGATRCPVTNQPVPADSATFPFVDARARAADLNKWFSGAYTVSRNLEPDDDPASLPPTSEPS